MVLNTGNGEDVQGLAPAHVSVLYQNSTWERRRGAMDWGIKNSKAPDTHLTLLPLMTLLWFKCTWVDMVRFIQNIPAQLPYTNKALDIFYSRFFEFYIPAFSELMMKTGPSNTLVHYVQYWTWELQYLLHIGFESTGTGNVPTILLHKTVNHV